MRRYAAIAAAGFGLWVGLWVPFAFGRTPGTIDRLFLLAPLVIVPLGLGLIGGPLPRLQAACAVCAAMSFLVRTGPAAAALALPWLGFGVACGIMGLRRLAPRGFRYAEELCADFALLYLPVGCGWLVLSRLGANPRGFSDDIVLLTAVHFHYAGFAALVFAAMVGRRRRSGFFPAIAGGAIGATPLLALGITFSHALEVAAAWLLAASLIALAIYTLAVVRPMKPLLAISCLALPVSMSLATAYALRNERLDIRNMALSHGTINAFAFALCGMAAWSLAPVAPRRGNRPMIFSRLPGRRTIGPDYFERIGAVEEVPYPPTGLIDNLDDYGRPDLETAAIDPEIRAFYERTADFELEVEAAWRPGFRTGARVFRRWADHTGQLGLPLGREQSAQLISSRIFKLRDSLDGRTNLRAWVRTYVETKRPVYVAAYSTHNDGVQTYMNIAFPLPRGNLASILRMELLPGGGVLLTTGGEGDQGIYFANRLLPVRLPLHETIRVWKDEGKTDILARHDLRLFGVRYLTLQYRIRRA